MLRVGAAALPEIASRGVAVPAYDRERLEPRLVHVGVGGFHRAHLAVYVHELAAAGADWGIVGLGLLEQDAAMATALAASTATARAPEVPMSSPRTISLRALRRRSRGWPRSRSSSARLRGS